MRRKSPVTIQQWVDSLPLPVNNPEESTTNIPESGKTKENQENIPTTQECSDNSRKKVKGSLVRDLSLQSDDASSHCSSVESVLELRRPDPEAVLISLGFGPTSAQNESSRIPKRFLQPSKLAGINVDHFLRVHQENSASTSFWPQLYNFTSQNLHSRDQRSGPPI